MLGNWTLTAVGAIERVERDNIDKSGRNPRYSYAFLMRPEHTSGIPEGATLPAELLLRAKGKDLERMTGSTDPFEAGDRVEVTVRAAGATPSSFYMTAARKL